tara:strand:+ start:9067 stop:9765 length:699 start_codon:yes stop_codon:yes gene_type:complete
MHSNYNINTISNVDLHGLCDIKVYHPEDVAQMEPLVDQVLENAIHVDLLKKINAEMHSSSGDTDFTLNHASGTGGVWFPQQHPGWSNTTSAHAGTVQTQQHGKDGIFARVNDVTGFVSQTSSGTWGNVQDFLLWDQTSTTQPSANQAQWIAQAEWTGGADSTGAGGYADGGSTSVSELFIGKYYAPVYTSLTAGFVTTGGQAGSGEFATANPADFTMAVEDILKVTWTITIG